MSSRIYFCAPKRLYSFLPLIHACAFLRRTGTNVRVWHQRHQCACPSRNADSLPSAGCMIPTLGGRAGLTHGASCFSQQDFTRSTQPLVFTYGSCAESCVVRQTVWMWRYAPEGTGRYQFRSHRTFITTGEILGLKKDNISEKVIFVNIKALLIWVVQDGLDLVQGLISYFLSYFYSSLWTLVAVAYIQANLSITSSTISVKQFAQNCIINFLTAEYKVRISQGISPASVRFPRVVLAPALFITF